jgi:hypothetical protein
MTYTQEQLDAIQAETHRRDNARNDLEQALREVLNSPQHEGLSNYCKAEILLDLENDGEYNPLG